MNLQDREERETAIVALAAALVIAALVGGKEITPDTALNRATEFIDAAQRKFPERRKPNHPPRHP